jgi:TonB-dependent receptor
MMQRSSLPFLRLFAAIGALLVLLPAMLSAQQASGGLRGSVQDADFFSPLSGVTLVLEGTSYGATSAEDGTFFINAIPPGAYTLLASREGFVRERVGGIVISPGSVKESSISLTGEVVELDEFTVEAEEIVETIASQPVQLRAELKSFTEVLGAQFISQTGASDAAKLVAKTTGVNVADGKFVVVRGLNDRYNVVSLNGLRVPSSDPDRRAVALDLFPAAVIQDIRTSKTFLPELNGESTGGTIDIFTKAVPDEDFVKFKYGTSYNTQATGNKNFLTYQGGGTGMFGTAPSRALPDFIRNGEFARLSGVSRLDTPVRLERQRANDTLSKAFGTIQKAPPMDHSIEASIGHRFEFMGAPAGITIAADYSKKYLHNDDDTIARYLFDPGTGEVQVTRRISEVMNSTETMRAGLLVSAGVQPDKNNQIVATYFFNRVAEDRSTLQFGIPDQNAFGPDERDYRETIAYTERDLRVMQLTGKHDLDTLGRDLQFSWGLSYNTSSQLEPDHRFVRGIYDLNSGNYNPIPGNPVVPEFQRYWRELYDQSYSLRTDFVTDLFEESDLKAKLKFGSFFDYSTRNYRADSFTYNRGAQNTVFPNPSKPGTPGDTWGDQFLYGNLPVGVDLDGIPNNGANNNVASRLFIYRQNAPETYQASQMLASMHAALDFDLLPGLNVTFGARLESTDLKVQATPIYLYSEERIRQSLLSDEQLLDPAIVQLLNDAFTGDPAAQADPRLTGRSRADITTQHLLPALSVNWDITEHTRLRAAISRTIARPSFKEISPVAFQNIETGDFFVGNRDLQLSSIMNFDTRWEWFPSPGSLVGISFFGKVIRNPIELSLSNDPVTGTTFSKYVNAPEGRIFGLELEFQRDLSFITPELRAFSLGMNYSFIYSQATRPTVIDNLGNPIPSLHGSNRRLQGQPDYIFNFNLTYDSAENPIGGGVFLNIVGPQLYAVGGLPEDPDVFQEPFTTLDLGLSYKVTPKTKLQFRAQNVLNPTLRRYYNNGGQPVFSTRQTGVGFSLSLSTEW